MIRCLYLAQATLGDDPLAALVNDCVDLVNHCCVKRIITRSQHNYAITQNISLIQYSDEARSQTFLHCVDGGRVVRPCNATCVVQFCAYILKLHTYVTKRVRNITKRPL